MKEINRNSLQNKRWQTVINSLPNVFFTSEVTNQLLKSSSPFDASVHFLVNLRFPLQNLGIFQEIIQEKVKQFLKGV